MELEKPPRPKFGGRKKGVPNKVQGELRDLASVYTIMALETLAEICAFGKTENGRVMASTALLDRAHGKPAQAITGADGGALGLVLQVVTGVERGDVEALTVDAAD